MIIGPPPGNKSQDPSVSHMVSCRLTFTCGLALVLAACGADGGGGAVDAADGLVVTGDDAAADAGSALDTTAADAIGHDSGAAADSQDSATNDGSNDAIAPDTGSDANDHTDALEADSGPAPLTPVAISPQAPVSAVLEPLGDHQATWLRALGDDVLIRTAKGYKLLRPASNTVVDLDAPIGTPGDAVLLGDNTLIAGSGGLFVFDGAKILPSPLGPAIDKLAGATKPVSIGVMHTVAGTNGPELWLIAGTRLHLYRQGKLHNVQIPGLAPTAGKLASGPLVGGQPALWIAAAGKIAAITSTGTKIQAFIELHDRPADAIAADADGRLWVASGGTCLVRDPDGAWLNWQLPTVLTDIVADATGKQVFVRTTSAIWLAQDGDFHALTGAPAVVAWARGGKGRALVAAKTAVLRLQTTPPPPKPKTEWSKHIKPIYAANCALCHSEQGVNTKLYGSAQWKARYDDIVKLTSAGTMPLKPKDPLAAADIATIKKWGKDGFLP